MAAGHDFRGEWKDIDPKDELQDYSGPFKPDLRFSDFSKKALFEMYLMAGEYMMEVIIAHNQYVSEKFGEAAVLEMGKVVWMDILPPKVAEFICRRMNIKGKTVEDLCKGLQIDTTWIPTERKGGVPGSRFDINFELFNENHAIFTVNRCPAVDMMESLGHADKQREFCLGAGSGYFVEYARAHNPDIETKILLLPPRKSKEDPCCQYEYILKK